MTEFGPMMYHRGLQEKVDTPNSLESLVKAKPGFGIELDTILLADGNVAIAHQKDMGKSIEEVEAMSLEDFEKEDLPTRFGEKATGQKMPLLEEVTYVASDLDHKIFLELKGSSDQKVIDLFDQVMEKIQTAAQAGAYKGNDHFTQNVSFHSFSAPACQYAVKKAQEEGLDLTVALELTSSEKYAQDMAISRSAIPLLEEIAVTDDWIEKEMILAKQIGCKGVAMNAANLRNRPDYIQKAHELGLFLIAGVAKDEDEEFIESLLKAGLDVYASENY